MAPLTYFPCKVSPPSLSPFHLQTLPSGQPPPGRAACWLLSSLAHSPETPLTFPDVASKGPGGCWQGLGIPEYQGPGLLPPPSSRLPPPH